jgi:hypothetical protein
MVGDVLLLAKAAKYYPWSVAIHRDHRALLVDWLCDCVDRVSWLTRSAADRYSLPNSKQPKTHKALPAGASL